MPEQTSHPSPGKPRIVLPPGATDTHCRVFGPVARFPYARETRFRPADAPKEELFALHDMLGIERCVVVQPNRGSGTDAPRTAPDAPVSRRSPGK